MRHFSPLHLLSFLVTPALVSGADRVRPSGTAKEAHDPDQVLP